jgi:hypothetical protein
MKNTEGHALKHARQFQIALRVCHYRITYFFYEKKGGSPLKLYVTPQVNARILP